MKKMLHVKQIGAVLLCAALATACSNQAATSSNTAASTAAATQTDSTATAEKANATDLIQKIEYADDDKYTDWSASNPTEIKLNGAGAAINGSGVKVKDSTITITSAGTYVVSGKLDDGQIAINVKDKGTVRLILNGAEIYNSITSPIYVEEAGKTVISLQEGTTNLVSDGASYVYADASTDEPNSAIFSKDDLTINGTGKLVVQGNYNNGITSKDKLKITGGTLEVHAVDDALMGRDLVAVQDGNMTIEAGGHGIKTSNDTEGSEGYLAIEGGSISITSGEDALHSSGGLYVNGGDLQISAGDDGIHGDVSVVIAEGTIDIAKSNEGIEAPTIVIAGGKTSLVASDDGVNASSGDAESAGEGGPGGAGGPGGFGGARPAGDQAAGTQPSGDQPSSDMSNEAQPGSMQPNGAQPPQGNPPGESGLASSSMLTITGGYLSVNAQGDGLDANGSMAMSGGTVIVNGPTNNGNGSLDYDGTFEMTGGFLVAAGSSGMAQAASDESSQPGILMTYSKAMTAGTLVHLQDSEGKDILTFAPAKSYQSLFISSPDLKKDAAYTLYTGGTSTGSEVNGLYDGGTYEGGTKVVDFTASSVTTWLSETGVTEARSGMGGPGGGPGHGGGGRGMPPQGEEPAQEQ